MAKNSTNPTEANQSTTEPMDVETHDVYFWDLVTFKVENRLFRVPRHPFVSGSPVFADKHGLLDDQNLEDGRLTSLLGESGGPAQGGHIPLGGVTVTEFEVFLRFMFPQPRALQLVEPSTKEFSKNEWLVILKLSTAWHFIQYRKLSIERLSTEITNPIELVAVAREHGVSKWLVSGYQMLVEREDPMTEQVGSKIGVPVAFRICLLREWLAKNRSTVSASSKHGGLFGAAIPSPIQQSSSAMQSLSHRIRAMYKDELAEMAEWEKDFKTKEGKEADEKVRRERERQEEEAMLEKSEEQKKERRRLEVEAEMARLAQAEEALRVREAQIQVERRELEKKAAQSRPATSHEAEESDPAMALDPTAKSASPNARNSSSKRRVGSTMRA